MWKTTPETCGKQVENSCKWLLEALQRIQRRFQHISIFAEAGREEAVASDKWEGLGKASGMTGGGAAARRSE